MRILVAAAAAIVMLSSASANAQSLERTYADLCSDPAKAKSESCVALAKALMAKLQGQGAALPDAPTSKSAGPDAATLAVWRKRWGYMLDTIDKEMFTVAGPEATIDVKLSMLNLGIRYKSTWKVPGEETVSTTIMADGTVQAFGGARWDEQNQRIEHSTNGLTAYSVAQPDGSVTTESHTPSGSSRLRSYSLPNGRIHSSTELLKDGIWVALPNGVAETIEYSPERVAQERERALLAEQQRVQGQLRQQQEEWAAKSNRSTERAALFGAVLQGLAQGAAEVNTGGYAEAQASLDATVANIQHAAAVERQQQSSPQRASQEPAPAPQPQQVQGPPGSSPSAAPASNYISGQDPTQSTQPAASAVVQREAGAVTSKELRFVMSISLRNQPGDKVNPTCYSNIISRPGPPGWGGSGFLPPGSAEQAREAVYGLKSAFIARCRASGREITSDGNFNFQMNQSQGDDERLQGMRARHSEDVSVSL